MKITACPQNIIKVGTKNVVFWQKSNTKKKQKKEKKKEREISKSKKTEPGTSPEWNLLYTIYIYILKT